MRTAIIADVHGNAPALAAVLADAAAQNVDRYILLGDYIFDMPFGNEVVDLMRAIPNAYSIAGNKEGYLDWLTGEEEDCKQLNSLYQTYRELSEENRAYLRGLPKELRIPSAHGEICAVHSINIDYYAHWTTYSSGVSYRMRGNPMPREEYLRYYTEVFQTEEAIANITDYGAKIVLFGHNHLQGHCLCGDVLVINPGSCGSPQDGDNRAAYSILDEDTLQVEERRAAYDIEAAIHAAKATKTYAVADIFLELVFQTLREGFECFMRMFKLADSIRDAKGGEGYPYTNEVWEEAYATYQQEQQSLKENQQ